MQKLTPSQLADVPNTLPAWRLDAQCLALHREFVVEDFAQAFGCMAQIAIAAERRNHHPEWSNVYNRVSITWTTHDVKGLSSHDVEMAQLCDRVFAPLLAANTQTAV